MSKTYDLTDMGVILIPNTDDIYKYGHRFNTFVASCSFNGADCLKETDFYEFVDPEFGKCFSFNHGKSASGGHKHTTVFGSNWGLRLLLTGQPGNEDYLDLYSRQMGVRVAIHEPDITPLMSETGFNIKYNDQTELEVKIHDINRLGEPWSKCFRDFSNLKFSSKEEKYRTSVCERTCLGYHIELECGCFHPVYNGNTASMALDRICDVLAKETCKLKNELFTD
ncbi:epithelial sodium channel subunit beta-like [Tachypleus tridentatus]|uniref:epithelial sodium channel subunit beta-like n=1 Tax=Tachypleus tridentatus TaxID=6853 RepID=UPI003FCF2052